jgi:hypothetical protein
VYPKVSGLSRNEINNNNNEHSLRSNTRGYGGKLTRLTRKIAIQLHLVAKSCTICSSRSRLPVRKLLDTTSYIFLQHSTRFLCILGSELHVLVYACRQKYFLSGGKARIHTPYPLAKWRPFKAHLSSSVTTQIARLVLCVYSESLLRLSTQHLTAMWTVYRHIPFLIMLKDWSLRIPENRVAVTTVGWNLNSFWRGMFAFALRLTKVDACFVNIGSAMWKGVTILMRQAQQAVADIQTVR